MRLLLALIVVGALVSTLYAEHQHSAQHQHGQTPASQTPTSQAPVSEGTAVTAPTSPAPRRATMQELHEMGGVPRGWKFSLPSGGDVARGRELFVNLECYKCHNVQGEAFPEVTGDAKYVGPDLSGMGGHHPAEYFAESVLSPNAVIITGQGYTGPDGLSIMPSFADSVSVGELLDLVAYMKSLTDGGNHDHHHAGPRGEAVAGPYRVRLVYAGGGHQHDHHQGHDHRAASKTSGHLMAFITDGAARRSAEAPGGPRLRPDPGGRAAGERRRPRRAGEIVARARDDARPASSARGAHVQRAPGAGLFDGRRGGHCRPAGRPPRCI